MNQASFLKIAVLTMLLAALLLFVQSVGSGAAMPDDSRQSAEKVNLALRRTAHLLLSESGDTTSRIPAVQHPLAGVWSIRLEHFFDYDRLPALLQESLALHGIGGNYDVAVLGCADGMLQLGYNYLDFTKSKETPCSGRSLESGCYDLQVTFLTSKFASGHPMVWLGLIGALLGILMILWRRTTSRQPDPPPETMKGLRIGNSTFDLSNQTLVAGNVRHHLTYREAKLLQLFASSPNQVLGREFILQSVWEDEGIIVGRSVDVFVSRLRKMLSSDPSLRMVAVHGVGYRLEVESGP